MNRMFKVVNNNPSWRWCALLKENRLFANDMDPDAGKD